MQYSFLDLAYLKEYYAGHKIIHVVFNSHEFIFRTLTRKEYKNILTIAQDEYELEDMICQIALIEPSQFEFYKSPFAGLSNYISQIIINESGFDGDIDNILNKFEFYRTKIKTFEEQCTLLIKAAFPEITLEEMEEWTIDKLLEMTARAEYIMKLKGHDIELKNKKEEVEEEIEKQKDLNEITKELRELEIDPMLYYKNLFERKEDFIDFPLIGGVHWDNEGVIYAIREQMEKRNITKLQ